ncbi:hypothetical protein B0I33_106177 [Prauserella shujinwangii]|uniref:Uncharacterized protein n=1 Tax=Prauserella shujinwangii TaxID=1453103 RepID=A0A2T0LTK8_9PSEU|nr:hypothetical protein [Prauserella shujinwangii]PRX47078.1 hypothetical protein B0I33_106177 [Prauserella shujinwangii]
MKTFLLGAAVGYVLGARAGRARYEQIVRTYRRIADHPAVQGAAGVARAKVGEKLGERVPAVGRRVAPSYTSDGQVRSASEPRTPQA